ncbi:chloroplast light harvesting protein isoform 12 [Chrysochromulina tobinii]|uniref:Chloroplast light harvesting protein isoform 12 n=1 Tax=Chrysochromulina tobinii TaxID=1460289 RepID=A0A0M0JZB0_9EUKA|nr:chloroplast light harvesting protein isoform 12 [Chrysochromulina tobinii]|eukprot:KOO31966.1 chloroplast light harvesting protein isoform 12 [Chrysochromulina sp. CCMP291]
MLSLVTTPLSLSAPILSRSSAPQMKVKTLSAKDQLIELALAQKLPMGFWDPLNLAEQNFWEQGNEATVGFLRHAEIKHGRVAMAAFVGYIVQANKICFPWALTGGPLAHQGPFADVPGETIMFSDIAAAGSPMAQWDALPSSAKCQILGTIFILEWIGEANMGAHYMRGGKPGFYPSLKEASSENGGIVPHPIPFDLFNPFGLLPEQTEAQKERGRNVEINNGRAAMLGIFGFISASKGLIVPGLDGIEGVGRYSGVYMGPFSTGDIGLPFVEGMLKSVPGLEAVLAAPI